MNSELSITEIALFVGYKNVDHFERIFRNIYGISPRNYRKNIKEKKDLSI